MKFLVTAKNTASLLDLNNLVAFAAIPVLIYQGILVIGAELLQPWLGESLLTELSATGGVLILGIALNMLNVTQIKLSNLLPALPIALVLASLPF